MDIYLDTDTDMDMNMDIKTDMELEIDMDMDTDIGNTQKNVCKVRRVLTLRCICRG